MARKPDKPWQFNVSFGLVAFLMVLVVGFFYQSFVAIRAVHPVEVAIERIKERRMETEGEATDVTGPAAAGETIPDIE